jgi:hypothetical protein
MFGAQANVLKNNVAYVPPAVVEADFMPVEDPGGGGHGFNATAIATLRLEAEKARGKKIRELKDAEPRFYSSIWAAISIESRELIKAHEDYNQADLRNDPNKLWLIIRETHHTNLHGGGATMTTLDKVHKRDEFSRLYQQPGMNIALFKKKFEDLIIEMKSLDIDLPPDDQLALIFLDKRLIELDMMR